MEELLNQHISVLRRTDPSGRLGLAVDEWGTWYDVEPGTNPGFLYQQNTMRDAIVAAINLNIFNNHCDYVVMANIAQMVNVLQAMILTEGEQMVCTPTYHVFSLYKRHQGARQLETYAQTMLIDAPDSHRIPNLHVSASEASDGSIMLTVVNMDAEKSVPVECMIDGLSSEAKVQGEVLSGKMDAYNTFDAPHTVEPQSMDQICIKDGWIVAEMPPCSVAAIRILP